MQKQMKSGGFLLDNNEKLEKEIIGTEDVPTEKEKAEIPAEGVAAEEEALPEEQAEPCSRCGEKESLEGSEFCEDCLNGMLNTKIPLIAWMAAAASVIVGIVAAATVFFLAAPTFLGMSAETAARDNRWSDAYYYYNQMDTTVSDFQSLIDWKEGKSEPVLRRLFSMGTEAKARKIEAYAKAYNPMEAISKLVIDGYTSYDAVVENEGKLLENKRVEPYWELFSGILYTEELMNYSEEYPEEENYENLLEFYNLIEKQKGADPVYVAYMKYALADIYDRTDDEKIACLQTCDKLSRESGRDYKWLYYYEYADLLAKTGRTDEAIALLDMLASENKNNFDAYLAKNRILLAAGRTDDAEKLVEELKESYGNYGELYEMEVTLLRYKGDYQRAKELAETAVSENDIFPEVRRQLALIYLAEGNYKNAFAQVETAYANAYNYYAQFGADAPSEELAKTYYVCAKLYEATGAYTQEEANSIGMAYEMFGEDFEPQGDMKAIISGEKTVKEILTEGDCDLV